MTHARSSKPGRRRLLASLAGAGGAVVAGKSIPGTWVRPVVSSVVLPAHAATSETKYAPSSGMATLQFTRTSPEGGNRLVGLLNKVIPEARALIPFSVYVCVDPSPDGATANVRAYQLVPSLSCAPGTYTQRYLYTAEDVPVPGSAPLQPGPEECSAIIPTSAGGILDRLGIIRSAQANGAATVELDSVENGAEGTVYVNGLHTFNIPQGSCSIPACCEAQQLSE
jgi:hypothetical protein